MEYFKYNYVSENISHIKKLQLLFNENRKTCAAYTSRIGFTRIGSSSARWFSDGRGITSSPGEGELRKPVEANPRSGLKALEALSVRALK